MAYKFFQISLASVLLFADLCVDVGYKVPPSFYGKDIALLLQHGIGFLDRIRIKGKVDGKRPHGWHLTPGGEDPLDDRASETVLRSVHRVEAGSYNRW